MRCENGTSKPAGSLADAETRRLRQQVYQALQFLRVKRMRASNLKRGVVMARMRAWLAREFDIAPKDAVPGKFDAARCRRVLQLCAPHLPASMRKHFDL